MCITVDDVPGTAERVSTTYKQLADDARVGDRLLVDMTTGVSRVESDSGRVQGLFISSGQTGGPMIPAASPSPTPTAPSTKK